MNHLQIPSGAIAIRPHWPNTSSTYNLQVYKNPRDNKLYYIQNMDITDLRTPRIGSSVYASKDFVITKIPTIKEPTMHLKFEELNYVSVSPTEGTKVFATEDEMLDYIAERIEINPKTEFRMYKPYQEIRRKRIDLKALISKIKF